MNLADLLVSPVEYLAPAKTLEGLSDAGAQRRLAGAPHSVAAIVAHMAFWQDWFYARCMGEARPMVASAAGGWPAVPPGGWTAVHSRFLERLEQLAALAATDVTRPVSPAMDFPPIADYTIGDVLIHVATHNAHHFGQIILLRQMMDAWPPPAGSWTW